MAEKSERPPLTSGSLESRFWRSVFAFLKIDRHMSVSSEILNEALCAYVGTFPRKDMLAKHIAQHHLAAQAAQITSTLDAMLKAAEDYLWGHAGGVVWTDTFEAEFRDYLRLAYPWLDARGFDAVTSFSGWLCWHEGLNAKPANA